MFHAKLVAEPMLTGYPLDLKQYILLFKYLFKEAYAQILFKTLSCFRQSWMDISLKMPSKPREQPISNRTRRVTYAHSLYPWQILFPWKLYTSVYIVIRWVPFSQHGDWQIRIKQTSVQTRTVRCRSCPCLKSVSQSVSQSVSEHGCSVCQLFAVQIRYWRSKRYIGNSVMSGVYMHGFVGTGVVNFTGRLYPCHCKMHVISMKGHQRRSRHMK